MSGVNSQSRLAGKVVVVTGSANGIGRAIATRCADEGADVVLVDRDEAALDSTVKTIETRMDGAFFSEKLIALLDELGGEYKISVPFERYTTIKGHVQERKRWRRVCDDIQFFEKQLSLQSWDCLLYTSPSPRDGLLSRMPSSA